MAVARIVFWLSAALLPVNLYLIAFGTVSPIASAVAAAMNVGTMVLMREML